MSDVSSEVFWNELYVSGQTGWDQGAPHPELLRLMAQQPELFKGLRVLVPGAGAGHDAVALTTLASHVTALDFSPEARLRFQLLYPDSLLTYVTGDFFAPPELAVDVIWEHTCLCAIHPTRRAEYFASVKNILPSGGLLVGILYNKAKSREEGPPFSTANDEILALSERDFLVEFIGPVQNTFPNREGRESLVLLRKK